MASFPRRRHTRVIPHHRRRLSDLCIRPLLAKSLSRAPPHPHPGPFAIPAAPLLLHECKQIALTATLLERIYFVFNSHGTAPRILDARK